MLRTVHGMHFREPERLAFEMLTAQIRIALQEDTEQVVGVNTSKQRKEEEIARFLGHRMAGEGSIFPTTQVYPPGYVEPSYPNPERAAFSKAKAAYKATGLPGVGADVVFYARGPRGWEQQTRYDRSDKPMTAQEIRDRVLENKRKYVEGPYIDALWWVAVAIYNGVRAASSVVIPVRARSMESEEYQYFVGNAINDGSFETTNAHGPLIEHLAQTDALWYLAFIPGAELLVSQDKPMNARPWMQQASPELTNLARRTIVGSVPRPILGMR